MRKQYHFRPSERGLAAWDVDRLLLLAQDQPTEQVPLDAIGEADGDYWFSHGYTPTVRAVVEHARLINEADLSYPIIIDPQGGVMDGMHRVGKALLIGQPTITAKRLPSLPPPDYVDVRPEDLPYDRQSWALANIGTCRSAPGVAFEGTSPNPSVAVYWRMATVLVEVTLPHVEDRSNPLPGDILAVVQALPHVQDHGWSRRGSSPWRARFLVRGADCIATARSLERRLRDLGYDADASFWP